MNGSSAAASAIHRRDFLALGGVAVAGVAIAGCGEGVEAPSASRDVELLSGALVGEENATTALQRAEAEVGAGETALVKALREQASGQAAELQDAVAELGDAPAAGDFGVEGSGRDGALRAALEATNAAVAAYRLGAGQFSEEKLKRSALEWISAGAVRLAAIRELLGEQPAPEPFVTGLDEKPLSNPDREGDAEAESTTTETTETTTTTSPTTTVEESP